MVGVSHHNSEDPDSPPRPPMWRAPLCPRPGGGVDVQTASRDLLGGVVREPWGQLSPSVYETGRLVTLAPWLAGHARRVTFLLTAQRRDGSWEAPDGYALVPTLSATEALLTTLQRGDGAERPIGNPQPTRDRLCEAAHRALSTVSGWLREPASMSIPDTPAVEIIVPALVAALNQHLDRLSSSPIVGLEAWSAGERLRLPDPLEPRTLAAIRASLDAGGPVATKLLHSLEVAAESAQGASGVQPVSPGTVGASPAATAAWLGNHKPPAPDDPAVQYLQEVVSRHAGAAPSVVPITVFERAWVLSTLATAGLTPTPPPQMLDDLEAAVGENGTPGGAGLPPDADTTSVALLTLAQLGRRRSLDCLWTFETDSHFVTWHGERSPSTTTNAHVLDAITDAVATSGDPTRAAAAAAKVARWLCDQQREDGTWVDKWHASAYYATACCALALHRFGDGGSTAAVRRAANWVLDTQRPDGSWGRWTGTVEETAYAMQTLLLTTAPDVRRDRAAARGYTYLVACAEQMDRPPLWHDKDLYSPFAVVQAAVLAALHLAQRNPSVMALAARG